MLCLYVCQQPDNSYLFKGHGSASPVGFYKLNTVGDALVQLGDKARDVGFKSVNKP